LCRYDVQRRLPCGNHSGLIAKAIPGSRENRSPSRRNHCSPSARNPVRLHPGTLFTITPEPRSLSSGIPIEIRRMRSASARSASRTRNCSSAVSDPSPSSNRQILNRLTPDRRANLLWDTPRAIRSPRRFSAAVAELDIVIVILPCQNVGAQYWRVSENTRQRWRFSECARA